MVVSDVMAVIDPYRHNTARPVPVAETTQKRAFGGEFSRWRQRQVTADTVRGQRRTSYCWGRSEMIASGFRFVGTVRIGMHAKPLLRENPKETTEAYDEVVIVISPGRVLDRKELATERNGR